MKFLRSLFPLILALPLLAAEPKPPAPITLDGLVAQALAENPELKFYEAEIAAAKGERKAAGAWANPEIAGELGRKRVRGDVSSQFLTALLLALPMLTAAQAIVIEVDGCWYHLGLQYWRPTRPIM